MPSRLQVLLNSLMRIIRRWHSTLRIHRHSRIRQVVRLSSDAHREAGALAARLGLDQVIAIGEKARLMAQGAGNIALHFDTVEQALPTVREALTPGTAMLVKASHAMEFHRIVEALTQEA